jgi:hypothetical protein
MSDEQGLRQADILALRADTATNRPLQRQKPKKVAWFKQGDSKFVGATTQTVHRRNISR